MSQISSHRSASSIQQPYNRTHHSHSPSRNPTEYTYLNKGIPNHNPDRLLKRVIIPIGLHLKGRSSFLKYFDNPTVLKHILYNRQTFEASFKAQTGHNLQTVIREKRDFIQSWPHQDPVSRQAIQALEWIQNLPDKSSQSCASSDETRYPVIDTPLDVANPIYIPTTRIAGLNTTGIARSEVPNATVAIAPKKRPPQLCCGGIRVLKGTLSPLTPVLRLLIHKWS